MRLAIIPALILLASTVAAATGDPTSATSTCCAAAAAAPTVAAERPWYIGPKGGDVRQGKNAALYRDATQVVAVVAAPTHCSRYVAPAVGPKGGILVSKGQSAAAVLAAADDACQALCNR